MNRKTFELNGLSCADCALKIENKIKLLDGVDSAQLSFATQKLNIIYKQDITDESMEDIIRKTVSGVEPGVEIIEQSLPLGSANKSRFTKQFKGNILVLTIGILLFCAGLLTNDYVSLVFLLLSWLIAGQSVLRMAISNIVKGHFFDENLLMTIATIGALVTGQYPEAAAVMLFYKVGMLLEDLAVDHSRKSIAGLMNLRPEYASIKTNEGIIKTDPEAVKVGDLLLVKPGERIPVDSVILEGLSLIDTSSLTGESLPQAAGPGQQVLGGTINKQSLLTLQAVNTLKQSAVTRILELVEDASSKKAHMESFISRFAVYYTPIVTIAAVLTAILPPILTGTMDFKTWLYRAMIFLVISCPCALVVSIPLTFFAGIGKASSKGILVKGGNYLEALNKVDTIVFDKTGTLTKGLFSVSDIIAVNCTEAELLEYAAYAEANSTHPIAQSIVKAYDNEIEANLIKSSEEAAGKGVKTIVKNQTVIAGNLEYVKGFGINPNIGSNADQNGTMVYVAVDNSYIGSIKVSDTLKPDAVKAVKSLRESSIRRIIMLTGDAREPAEAIADQLQLDEFHYGLLPHQKVEWFEKIKKMSAGGTLFVGDGINDAPVLAEADIGVSMGGIGSDAAIEASDIVLMTDEPSKLNDAFKVAALTRKIAIQNVVFALIVKVLVMFLGASGSASMWEAVFADVGVTLLAVLNTMRIRYSKI